MRYSLITLLIIAAWGCSTPTKEPEKNETLTAIDSIIGQSQKNLVVINSTSKRTDSAITGKIEKTVKRISILKEDNTKLKKENEHLKDVVRVTKSIVIRDTIYIKEKTNFWGKKKISTDSIQSIDSTEHEN